MKGLIVEVYRGAEIGDCTNGGPSSKVKGFTLIDDEVPGIFEPTEDRPALVLVRRVVFGKPYIHAVPYSMKDEQTMMGGNFVYTSDSRLRAVSQYPIPVHDRVESASYQREMC
jgi:hypothetical protein